MKSKSYKIAGLMSGTSLDGLDIAVCELNWNDKWSHKLLAAHTVPYSKEWREKLKRAHLLDAYSLQQLNNEYGSYIGALVDAFFNDVQCRPDYISSHGHTVFHNPTEGISFQIGNGANIASQSRLPVICDFRTTDIAYGGQGAPLVPIGDLLLYRDFSHCLNIGGIANISIKKEDEIIAYDICSANMILNYLAGLNGCEYDENGKMSREGVVIPQLLAEVNQLAYFQRLCGLVRGSCRSIFLRQNGGSRPVLPL